MTPNSPQQPIFQINDDREDLDRFSDSNKAQELLDNSNFNQDIMQVWLVWLLPILIHVEAAQMFLGH